MKYTILQLKADTEDQRNKWFIPYSELTRKFGKVDLNDYFKVYEGETEFLEDISSISNIVKVHLLLDELFEQFNMYPPKDFKGHSLSVSDIVTVEDRVFYCDDIGWKEIKKENIAVDSMWDRLYRLMSHLDKRPNGATVELEQSDYDFFTKIGFVSEDGYISFHGKRFCLG
jgi:hypothetical protein